MLKQFLCTLAFLVVTPFALAQQPATKAAAKPAAPAKPATVVASAKPKVILHTTQGNITIELDAEKAPKTVDNFLQYVKDGFYNGTVFHRVIAGFMIQGGGYDKDLHEKPTRAPIRNEANNDLSNLKYTVTMARTPDPHSAKAQFFVNLVDNKRLDYTGDQSPATWGYCVFGTVIKGQEVVDKIAALPTGASGQFSSDVPITPIVIEKAELLP